MSVTFRAVDEPAASRMDHWQHVVGEMLAPLDLRSDHGLDVPDQLRVGDVGAVRVAELSVGSASTARRTPRLIRRSDPDLCKLDVAVDGRALVDQRRPRRWVD